MADASRILMKEGDSPITPPSDKMAFYPKDKNFFMKDSDGKESVFGLPDVNDPAKYVCYVDLNFNTNLTAHRFNKIQDAINWIYNDSGWYSELSNSLQAIIYIYPGKYIEQINTYNGIRLQGINNNNNYEQKVAYLYNTGLSEDTYPIGFDHAGVHLSAFGLNIRTELNGVYGKTTYSHFNSCSFKNGHWIEYDGTEYQTIGFRNCNFFASYSEYIFNLTGTRNKRRSISFIDCKLAGSKIKMNSVAASGVAPGYGPFTVINTSFNRCPWEIGGDWDMKIENAHCFSPDDRNIINTTGYVDIQKSIISNGIHFLSAPSSFTMLDSSFKDTELSPLDSGEADITSDVDIVDVDYVDNVQRNGLCGCIQINNTIKKVGSNFSDSYHSFDAAIKASVNGDIIQLDNGTFTGNFILPNGVNVQGMNEENTILISSSGTTLTLIGSGSIISKINIKSAPSGAGAKTIQVNEGSHELQHCKIEMNPECTFGNIISISGGSLDAGNVYFSYAQSGATTGVNDHIIFKIDCGVFRMIDTRIDINIADLDDNFYLIQDDTIEEINISKNTVVVTTASSGTTALLKQTKNSYSNSFGYNNITISGPVSGVGYCYIIDNDSGEIKSTCNTVQISGFNTNYFGNIGNNTTLKSHFDNIDCQNEVIGTGDYQYVNSPDPGDLRLSGALINLHDNDLVVAKSGGEFTSIKDALDSITDNDSEHRYNIHVHSGFYYEDNPIIMKPYVFISGSFKHNPRLIPLNQDKNLIELSSGYCAADIGELTLQAPSGGPGNQVYIMYAPSGSSPIVGLYNCLFLGSEGDGSYCNGFYVNNNPFGFHTVNCMAYGSFNNFCYTNTLGGAWTDSGFLPEATTTMNKYLNANGPGIVLIDVMRNVGNNIKNLIYANHPDIKLSVSDIYSLDQQTLKTGDLGGEVVMRGSTLRGNIDLDAGDISLHGCSFEGDGKINATTGNLDKLIITSTRNISSTTHCVKVTGGGTEVFIGGGNIMKSQSEVEAIVLDGTFSSVTVEGVKQYNFASIACSASETITHLPDSAYSRMIQIQAYPAQADIDNFDYINESDYTQEDSSKTDFINSNGGIKLQGIGLNPYGHWHYNETTGQNIADSSGNGRNGTAPSSQNIDWIVGHLNNCLKFDVNEYSTFGNIASWERSQSFSLECWLYVNTISEVYVMSKMEDISGVYRGYGMYLDNRYLHFTLMNNATNKLDVYYNSQLTAATWYHCVATYDGSSIPSGCHIYINNVDVALTIDTDNLSSTIINTANFQISGRDGVNNVFNGGRVDEAAIYDKELNKYNTDEITYRYNTGTGIETMPGTYDNTQAWYVTPASGARINTSAWTNISGIVFDEEIESNTSIKYLVSMDAGVSWNKWTGSAWVSGGLNPSGNTSSELEFLSAVNWGDLFIAGTLDIVAYLETSNISYNPILNNININHGVPGSRVVVGDSKMQIELLSETQTKLTNISDVCITGLKVNISKLQPY